MSKRISLREFQESLVRRLNAAGTADRRTLLGLQAGDRQWLVPLAEAGEILPVPPLAEVPLTRPWFRGLANVRGTLYGVIDLSAFTGGALIAPVGQARLVLVGAKHGVNCALLVARTTGLKNPDDFEAAPPPATPCEPWESQRLRDVQARPWHQLDVPALLAHPRFLEAGVAS
jgi:twitching motility protein PilI